MEKLTKTKYKRLEKLCLESIQENNIIFADELFSFTEISPQEFRKYKLDESIVIKDAIEINRAKLKRELRFKWFESTNATMNVALYKLICTAEERKSFGASSSGKADSDDRTCTQEDYLKSLREMGDNLEGAESAD